MNNSRDIRSVVMRGTMLTPLLVKRNIRLLAAVLILTAIAGETIILRSIMSSKAEASISGQGFEQARLSENISVQAAGRGNPYISLSDGRQVITGYDGADELVVALEQDLAKPLSLASADFDEDGVPDLVSGYSNQSSGIITLHRGNVDSIYPNSPEAKQRRAAGRFSESPFLSPAMAFAAPEAVDFVGAGDFDCDGHWDVVVAARGSRRLYLMSGDGRGGLGEAKAIELPGAVTALITGEINRRDGLDDVMVAVSGPDGAKALVFEGPEGALRADPEVIALPAEATSLALGQLDDEYTMDLAIAAGRELVVVHGRDRKLSLDEVRRAEVPEAKVGRREFSFELRSLALGDFDGDQRTDLSVLSNDGGVYLLREGKRKGRKNTGALERWESKELARGRWGEASSIVTARVSSTPLDNLVIVDPANHRLDVIAGESGKQAPQEVRLDVASEPVAVLPMRLNVDALNDLVVLRAGGGMAAIMTTPQATFTVTNTNDSGAGSLRQAIIDANLSPGADLITFNIPGGGIPTITPLTNLGGNFETVTIDGTTQPSGRVELDGSVSGTDGLAFTGGNSVIRGFVINRYFFNQGAGFGGHGIVLDMNGGNIIEGNFIGTDITGSSVLSNTASGVLIFNGSTNNLIGGTTLAARNVIAGNGCQGINLDSGGNQVRGNLIGTDATGTIRLNNSCSSVFISLGINNNIGGTLPGSANVLVGHAHQGIAMRQTTGTLVQGNLICTDINGNMALGGGEGIFIFAGSSNNTVGGTVATARNIISGSNFNGISINTLESGGATGNLIQGNFIGTDISGTVDLGNSSSGVQISGTPGNTVGGTAAGAGNVISGNNAFGVSISGPLATGNQVQGNFIGTDTTGASDIGNTLDGVFITNAPNNLIGGSTAASRNIISGNDQFGIGIAGPTATGNRVQGNFIGTDGSGTSPLGNHVGVFINSTVSSIIGGSGVGEGNVIAFNSLNGVHLVVLPGPNNRTLANSIFSNNIFSNNGLGIDLGGNGVTANDLCDGDTGPNNLQNFPVLSSASSSGGSTTVEGSLNSSPNSTYTIQFFSNTACDASGFGEGETFIGSTSVTTTGGCTGFFSVTLPVSIAPGQFITATATDPIGNTSEFSNCIQVSCLTGCTASAPGTGDVGSPVQFTASATFDCPTTPAFNWSFGDSSPDSSLQNPSHTYTTAGVFNWMLTVSVGGSPVCTRTGAISILATGPVINSFSPTGGFAGTTVIITGLNFNGATSVTFNGLSASFTVLSPSQIIATVPVGATTGPISVQTPGGTAVSTANFVVGTVSITVNSSLDNNSRDSVLTLREAILIANGTLLKAALTPSEQALVVGSPSLPSLDEIRFSIASGPQTISLNSALATITGPVVINATTQPGFTGNPIIELRATGQALGASGLRITAGGSTVRGLVINSFSGDGIILQSLGGNLIAGNFIGTGLSGLTDLGNSGHGVNLIDSSDNLIGGVDLASRNVISGNSGRGISILGDRNRVQGNLIGVGADGTTPLGNDLDGVSFFGSDNTIGARLNPDGTVSGLRLIGLSPTGSGETSNTIAFNQTGVLGLESRSGGESSGNSILSNLIYSNETDQIKLQTSCPSAGCTAPPPANAGQAAPVLDSVSYNKGTGIMTIVGSVVGQANTDYFLQFFLFDMCPGGMPSGNPQSLTSLPIVRTTNSFGSASFTIMLQVANAESGFVNATSTDPRNNTSPYSLCAQINGGCSFSITPNSLTYPAEGGTNGVTVLAQSGCNWIAMSNNPEFITITSGNSGSGLGNLLYTVSANQSASPRIGTMTIAGQTFTVSQNAQACSFMISPPNQNFTLNGGQGNVMVTASAGCNWTAVSNNPDFITILSPLGGGGSGDGMVSFIVSASTGPPRVGTMTIAGQTFTVMQESGCSYFIDRQSQSFSASAGAGTVNVIAGPGCGWTAVSNNPEFITVTSGGGSGVGTVTYSVAANSSTSPRSGTVTVAGQTFTIAQGALFNDVPESHQFFSEISKLSARGVTLGCGNGNYCPDQPVSRDQMAAFIIRARGELNPPAPAMQRFLDVPPQNIFYAFIDRMAVLQITLGCGGGNYCPTDAVTREQMAAFMIRGLSIFSPPQPAQQRFLDVPPSNLFYAFIEEMAVRQITLGCGGGNYCPMQSVTRAQMAAFLVRAFSL